MNNVSDYITLNDCPLCGSVSEHKHVLQLFSRSCDAVEAHYIKVGCTGCELQLRFELEQDLSKIECGVNSESYQDFIEEKYVELQEKWNTITIFNQQQRLTNAYRIMRIIANQLKDIHQCRILHRRHDVDQLTSFVVVDQKMTTHIIVTYHINQNFYSVTRQSTNSIDDCIVFQTVNPDCRPYTKFSFAGFCKNQMVPIPKNSNIHWLQDVTL